MGRLSILLLVFYAIGCAQLSYAQSSKEPRVRRGASDTGGKNWEMPIPYTINSAFSEEQKTKIKEGVASIMSKSCINFEEDFSSGKKLEYWYIGRTSNMCSSPIGDARDQKSSVGEGNHIVRLSAACVDVGSVQHETMHALGFQHTQSRADRDTYLTVNESNIRTGMKANFLKIKPAENSPDYGIPFEFGSRLMYNAYLLNIGQNVPVLTPHDEGYLSSMGASKTLTFYDWKMLNIRYNCETECTTKINCQNGGFQHPRNCSRCICSDFHDGDYCEIERGVIELKDKPEELTYEKTVSYQALVNDDWNNFYVEPVRVIKAPKNRRIRVTIDTLTSNTLIDETKEDMFACPSTCDPFAVEITDGDLAYTGKKYCCTRYIKETSFVSKSNIIGYRAYSNRGISFKSKFTFSIEPETVEPPTTTTVSPETSTTIPSTTIAPTIPESTTIPPTDAQPTTVSTTTVDSRTTIYDTDTNQCEY